MGLFALTAARIAPGGVFATTIDAGDAIRYRVTIH
jgi:hypothetical protein